jgi:hypothetical protein
VRGGYGPAWAAPQNSAIQYAYTNPWAAGCSYACAGYGISGVGYMFLDALVNGNGAGYDNINGILTDPTKPYNAETNPYTTNPWGIGPVNYLFEPYTQGFLGSGSSPLWQSVSEGYSATAWYALRGTIGEALPALQGPIDAFFWGTYNLTFAWETALYTVATVASLVPLVGPFVGNSIYAYLGDLPIPDSGGLYYQYGLSGVLNYWTDVLTGSYTPPPAAAALVSTAAATRTAAVSKAVAATAAVAEAVTTAATDVAQTKTTAVVTATDASAPASTSAAVSTTAVEATATTPAEPAAQTATDATASATPTDSTPAATAPASPSNAASDSTAAASPATASAPASVKTRKRPVRDAVAGAAKAVTSAVSGAAKAATGGAAAAKAGSAAGSN